MSASSNHDGFKRLLRPVVLPMRYWRGKFRPAATYAGDGEDVVVDALLGRVDRFVDVGANDGVSSSNTLLFALRGAEGLCFEPDPWNFARLRAFYRLQRRVECVPEGLSDRIGSATMRADGLLSSLGDTDEKLDALLSSFKTSNAPEVTITLGTLAEWFGRRPKFAGCDLLSIDVEGHELAVLRGIDWKATPKPARAVVVETHADGKSGSWQHKDLDAIAGCLEARDYCVVVRTANNTVWLHADDLVADRLEAARMRLPQLDWAAP